MTIQITIIGLGQVGASIGLALATRGETIRRVGHDKSLDTARRAQKMGAVEQVEINLPASVRQADIILLCIPMDQVHETLQFIAEDIRENAVLMDTSPVKTPVLGWVKELLPEKRHFVGLTPVINPAYLRHIETGLEAAHADLFEQGLFAIVSPPNTPPEALKLATDLVGMLGASPLFADPLEVDGLMAAMHTLPQLVAAALLNATVDRPGWKEARKIAGRDYAQAAEPGGQSISATALETAAILNQENVVRTIDEMMAALSALREDIAQMDSAALHARLESAKSGHGRWMKERLAANWAAEGLPEVVVRSATEKVDLLSRLFGNGWRRKDKK